MTAIHQQGSIENAVTNAVGRWNKANTFTIKLTVGWGEPLYWTVCEFFPKGKSALIQYQYFQDPVTRQMTRYEKYSPPLVIEKFEREHQDFSAFLESLYTRQHLLDFSEMCYASQSRIDTFQEELLELLCKLYLAHEDVDERVQKNKKRSNLKDLLKRILRMLILTYIMAHTMTIDEEELPEVLRRVPSPPASFIQQDLPWANGYRQMSPQLANRQLKFYFCVLRENSYTALLREMQTILTSSVNQNETWLPAFCLMLGFAMVLEEVQCNLQIQADSKTREQGWDVEDAQRQAHEDCRGIDETYNLMILIFQKKYRDPDMDTPRYSTNQTPRINHPAELDFLHKLGALVEHRSKTKIHHRPAILSSLTFV